MYLEKLKRKLHIIQLQNDDDMRKINGKNNGKCSFNEIKNEANGKDVVNPSQPVKNTYVIAFGENAKRINLNGIIDPKKTHVHHLHDNELSFHFMQHLVNLQGKKNILFLNKCLPIISELPQEEKSNIFLYSVG